MSEWKEDTLIKQQNKEREVILWDEVDIYIQNKVKISI